MEWVGYILKARMKICICKRQVKWITYTDKLKRKLQSRLRFKGQSSRTWQYLGDRVLLWFKIQN